MQRTLTTLLLSASTFLAFGQMTYVPDNQFEQALIDLGYDSGPLDDYVPTANIESVNELDIKEKDITDLTGIEDFKNLTTLKVDNNPLGELDITALPKLALLHANNTGLSEINLASSAKLKELMIGSNQISGTLDLSGNPVLDLLWVPSNNLSGINLEGAHALRQMACGNNPISELDVSPCPQLTGLFCGYMSLSYLDVSQNPILREVSAGYNQLKEIRLGPSIESLYVKKNQLTSLNLYNSPALSFLRVDQNPLTYLDLSQLPELTDLYARFNNQLKQIDLRNGRNTQLTFISLYASENIECVSVDDPAWSEANWTDVPAGVEFSEACYWCPTTYDHRVRFAVGSYTSPSGNHTWTESGTYTDVFVNESGCPHELTIDLTIVQPHANPIQLWGMTSAGGTGGDGVIFSLDVADGEIINRHDLNDFGASENFNALMTHSSGTMYGVMSSNSRLFSISPNGAQVSTEFNFNNTTGFGPQNAPIEGANGKLYGMTQAGGAHARGTLYEYDPTSQALTVLHSFESPYGRPFGRVIQAANGKVYGATSSQNDVAMVFEYDLERGQFRQIVSFENTGIRGVFSNVVEGNNGLLYGMSSGGGDNNQGTIYVVDPERSTVDIVHSMSNATTGVNPFSALLPLDNNKMYGLANGGGGTGTIFSFDPNTEIAQIEHTFSIDEGGSPNGTLIQGSDGRIYGTCERGGTRGRGSIFAYDPVSSTFDPIQRFNLTNGANPLYGRLTEVILDIPQEAIQPQALHSYAISEVCANLTWSVSSPVNKYMVRYSKIDPEHFRYKTVEGNYLNLCGLDPATSYRWAVKPFVDENTVQGGQFKNDKIFHTAGGEMCDPISGFSTPVNEPNLVQMQWNSNADYYHIRWDSKPQTGWKYASYHVGETFEIVDRNLAIGDYRVQIRPFCGSLAGDWKQFNFSVAEPVYKTTGIEDFGQDLKAPYPNPTNGTVQLPLDTQWSLLDATGRLVDTGNGSVLDLTQRDQGMYMIEQGGVRWRVSRK